MKRCKRNFFLQVPLRRFASGILGLCLSGCVGMGGEVITLTHEPLGTVEQGITDSLAIQSSAEDLRTDRSRIGNASVSLFAIEHGNVTTQKPVTRLIVPEVKSAFESVGYRVSLVKEGDTLNDASPILIVGIKEFYFQNYNYLWPYVRTWGDIELVLTLKRSDGTLAFNDSFKGSGSSHALTGEEAFSNATKEALTEVLKKIQEAGSSDKFRQALRET